MIWETRAGRASAGFFMKMTMARMKVDKGDALSPEAVEQVVRLLVASPRRRLSCAVIDGRIVWIKRFDTESLPLAKRVHGWLSPLLPSAILRASPALDAAGLAAREARKAAGFQAAGFPTPAILWRGKSVLVMSQVARIGEPLLAALRDAAPDGHEETLVGMADALGRAHAAGLCHGRPHPRDMFVRDDGEWGFLDFEEEPEAAMPLAAAQARDVWLMFMQIAARALDEETTARAFAAWRAQAPAQIGPELRKLVAVFSLFLPGLKALRPLGLGKDGQRLLQATTFLRAALRGSLAGHPTPDRIGTPT